MIINVKVIPNAKKNLIKEENGFYKIHVTSLAINNKANETLINVLSDHFKLKKNLIKIIKGDKSRKKVIEIGC